MITFTVISFIVLYLIHAGRYYHGFYKYDDLEFVKAKSFKHALLLVFYDLLTFLGCVLVVILVFTAFGAIIFLAWLCIAYLP